MTQLSLLLAGLLGVCLLAFVLWRLRRWQIARKGLILSAVPFMFVVGLLVLVAQVRHENERAQAAHLHSKLVIAQAQHVIRSLLEAQASVNGYVITNDPHFAEPFARACADVRNGLKDLRLLVQDNPAQQARAARLDAIATERIARLDELHQLLQSGTQSEAATQVKSGEGQRLMDQFRLELAGFLQEEERLDEARRQTVAASWRRLDGLLLIGAALSLLLTLALALLFHRGISSRLQTLAENTQRLAAGQELATPITGADELARLDRVFHDMAQQLQLTQGELEARVAERTHDLSMANQFLKLLLDERTQATAEIKQLNETLERRIAARTAELEAANRELEAFSYSVSHDLRAPLRAINGFSRILVEDHAAQLNAEGQRVLDVIRGNTQQMAQLIDDLLAFSRFSRKPLAQTEIDMNALVNHVRAQLAHAHAAHACRWHVAPLPPAQGDRALVTQVFVNLLSNAVKYTRDVAEPRIEVGCEQSGGEHVYYVRDNGVGFDMRYASQLFGVFQRLHSNEEFEGTGVGLAIVKRIVERHGGRVWAVGRVQAGATFYFTLPGAKSTDEGETEMSERGLSVQ
ncbi:MAG: sensor histidine kinase [Pyrinomonadaceae bacterium]